MASNLQRRIISTLSASGFGQLVTLGSQFAFVPIFIAALGVNLYGEWLILFSIPLYISMADIGFSEYFNNKSAIEYAENKEHSSLISVNTGFIGTLAFSLFFVCLLIIVYFVFDLYYLFNLKIINYSDSFFIFTTLSIYSMLCCVTTFLSSSFRVERNYSKGVFTVNFIRVFEVVVCVAIIALTTNLVYVSLGYLVVRLIGCIYIFNYLIKSSSFLHFSLSLVDFKSLLISLKESFYFALFPVSLIASSNGISTIVGICLGPKEVVIFNCLRTISRVPFQIVNAINSSVWQEVSYLFSRKNADNKLFNSILFKSVSASFLVSVIFSFVLLFTVDYILLHWTGGAVKRGGNLFLLLLCAICLNSLWFSASVFLRASNNHKSMFAFYFIIVFLTMYLIAVTVDVFGLIAIGYCLIVLEFFMCIFVFKQIYSLRDKYIKGNLWI
jgi:O-antigen/teichoic acid export membrane protein